jgi:hypothetical protein
VGVMVPVDIRRQLARPLAAVPGRAGPGPHHGFYWAARAAGRSAGSTLQRRFGIEWQAADDRHVMARFGLDGVAVDLQYELEDDGRIRSVVFDRWGDPDRARASPSASSSPICSP